MLVERTNGYAWALFSIAQEEKKQQKIKADAQIILEALKDNEAIFALWNIKVISEDKLVTLITEAFGKLNKYLVNFILLVSIKKRSNYIVAVLKKLISLINENLNIKEGVVYTTIALSAAQLASMEKRAQKLLGFKPTLINKLDPDLISGFKIIINDKVIEDSIISRIHNLKHSLLKGGA